jgi:putative nucleotidyltransferase with HDIG domain
MPPETAPEPTTHGLNLRGKSRGSLKALSHLNRSWPVVPGSRTKRPGRTVRYSGVHTDAHALLERFETLPVIPAVAARVLSLSDDATSALEVSQVISADPVLTATLLRVSNSAYYGFSRRLSTVREAVLLLGFKQVRQIAVGASVMRAWKRGDSADGFDMDLFWGHCMSVAVLAEMAARKFNAGRPEEAFTAGILHDVGVLALRQALPVQFRAVMKAAAAGAPMLDAERELAGLTHTEIGAALAERWQLPERLVEAIAGHHHVGPTDRIEGLADVVCAADQVAERYGVRCGFAAGPIPATVQLPEQLATLEIACGGMGAVLERAYAFISNVSGRPGNWYGQQLLAA